MGKSESYKCCVNASFFFSLIRSIKKRRNLLFFDMKIVVDRHSIDLLAYDVQKRLDREVFTRIRQALREQEKERWHESHDLMKLLMSDVHLLTLNASVFFRADTLPARRYHVHLQKVEATRHSGLIQDHNAAIRDESELYKQFELWLDNIKALTYVEMDKSLADGSSVPSIGDLEGSNSLDESNTVMASEILRDHDPKNQIRTDVALNRILDRYCDTIRSYKPSKNRRRVHLVDWINWYKLEHGE